MARRRHVEASVPDVRKLLAEQLREMDAIYGGVMEADGDGCFRTPWAFDAARLDAGEPFEVSGWQLFPWVDGVGADDRLRVEADGWLTVLRRGVTPPPDPARTAYWREREGRERERFSAGSLRERRR